MTATRIFSQVTQESLLDTTVVLNAIVTDIEKTYVAATLRLTRQLGLRNDLRVNLIIHGRNDPSRADVRIHQLHRMTEIETEMKAAEFGASELTERQPVT